MTAVSVCPLLLQTAGGVDFVVDSTAVASLNLCEWGDAQVTLELVCGEKPGAGQVTGDRRV